MIRKIGGRIVIFAGSGSLLAVALLLLIRGASAQSQYPPLFRNNWTQSAPQGFGDRQNSWPWSMAWFQGKLFVGTVRAEQCVTDWGAHVLQPAYPYPPTDPDLSCTPDPNDLPLQAEIWSWDPSTKAWTRVFQSPNNLAIPGTNPVKYTAPDIGFRGMLVYTEADGTQALYVSGCSSNEIHPTLPGGRILRTTDGVNFTPVPQDPGTFLGDLGNACFRGMVAYNPQGANNPPPPGSPLFIMAVDWKGEGTVLETSNPSAGDNAYMQISNPATPAYEVGVFNNLLYVTFVGSQTGFDVDYTNATGPLPYTYTPVILNGGYRNPFPNPIALSMQVFNGSLYVGGDGVRRGVAIQNQGAELFRINPDNSWDLIAGISRSTPNGYKSSQSGLGPGFGWILNDHMWRMDIYDGRLYVGTFDDSTTLRLNPTYASAVAPELGFDLWWTSDGSYYSLIDQNGFEDQFNFGVRSLQHTPYGEFLGGANPYYGLKMYMGIPTGMGPAGMRRADLVEPPERLQVETAGTSNLLAWDAPASGASKYHVFRWTFNPNNPLGTASAYEEVGTTTHPYYADNSTNSTLEYAYQIKAEDLHGNLSSASNFVRTPAAAPPATFASVASYMRTLSDRGQFISPDARLQVKSSLAQAQEDVSRGDLRRLHTLWQTVKNSKSQLVLANYARSDLEIMISRLLKRAELVQAGLLPAGALGQ